jgi:ferredoxin
MKVVTAPALRSWLDALAREKALIAPKEEGGVLLYRRVAGGEEIAFPGRDALRPVTSIKEAFFPQTDRLLLIERLPAEEPGGPRPIRLDETLPDEERVVFGVRPCDAAGLRVLDAAFLDKDPIDPYYRRRRERSTLIGMACPEMGPTCFCKSVGGGPDDAGDVDLMLYEVEGGYAVRPVTKKGTALIEGLPLAEVSGDPRRSALVDPVPVPDMLAWPPHFRDGFWEGMAERCLSCRLCAYVCPTCRCFDIRDESLPDEDGRELYERVRCWDSCAGEPFRRIAGGHNPRAEKGQRLRNRYFCKFYYYPEQYGPAACTGCGRCIDVCPVGIDITEVLAHLVEG